jgi:hypothetical protein
LLTVIRLSVLFTAQHSAVAFHFFSDWCFIGATFIFSH